jgi:hypothetical protein
MKQYKVIESDGTVCEKCLELAEVRERCVLREKTTKQPYYFTRWYNCRNKNCRRTLFMKDEYKVENHNGGSVEYKSYQQYQALLDEFQGRMF